MDIKTAESIALIELRKLEPEIGVSVDLCTDKTIEKRLAWVFFYNSQEFITTGKSSSRLMGNGPIVVMKANGQTTSYGSVPIVADILAALD